MSVNLGASCCFVCLNSFEFLENEDKASTTTSKIYRDFLSFAGRYLGVPWNVWGLPENINCDAYRREDDKGKLLAAFCETCSRNIGEICELYSELCGVELRLSSKLGELGELMKDSKKKDVKALAKYQGFGNVSRTQQVRNVVTSKCLDKCREIVGKIGSNPISREVSVKSSEPFVDEDGDGDIKMEPETSDSEEEEYPFEAFEDNDLTDASEIHSAASKSKKHVNDDRSDLEQNEEAATSDENDEEVADQEVWHSSGGESDEDVDSGTESEASISNPSGQEDDSSDTEILDAEVSAAEMDEYIPQPKRRPGRPRKSTTTRARVSRPRLQCCECDKDFARLSNLHSHLLQHENQLDVKGVACCFCYMSIGALEQTRTVHMQLYHSSIYATDKPFICQETDCGGASFGTVSELNEHLTSSHSHSKPVQHCQICQWGFLNDELFKLHQLVHTKPLRKGEYPCTHCNSKLRTVNKLQSHFNTRHGNHIGCFPCLKCGLRLAKEVYLKKHLKKHEKNNGEPITELLHYIAPPPCTACGLQFQHLKYLDKHRKKEHNLGVECPTCHKLFSVRNAMFRHNQIVHKKIESHVTRCRPCPHCQKIFTNPEYLREHIALRHPNLMHGEGKYKCFKCQADFHRKFAFETHLARCGQTPRKKGRRRVEEKVPCRVCGKKVFPTKLKNHLETHMSIEERQQIVCEVCGKVCLSQSLLNQHVQRVHNGFKPGNSSEQDCICHLCGKVFLKKTYLLQHQKSHSENRERFSCHLCLDSFTVKTSLKTHLIKQHGKEKGQEFTPGEGKALKCVCMFPSCGVKFVTGNELQFHVEQNHSLQEGEKEFMCNLCGKVLANHARLIRHNVIHTKEKSYKCLICSKALSQRSSLKEHMMTIHNKGRVAEEFPCGQPDCTATFKSQSYRYRHLRQVHGVYTAKPKKKVKSEQT